MLPLNVPFIPDDSYLDFLKRHEERLQSVHFSIHDPRLQDARIHLENIPVERFVESLGQLKKPRKYLLANGRFHSRTSYEGKNNLHPLIQKLEGLLNAGLLDGIVFADSYMLTLLADAAPSLAAEIEAIPSVNFRIDSIDTLAVVIELIASSGFKMPGKVTLDRSLNRDLDRLDKVKEAIDRRYADITVELLANEGCLPHCPYRATHEALISFANCSSEGLDTRRLNNNLGCVRRLEKSPWRILSSPFIRPEDVDYYFKKADVIKICGRTLGAEFLQQTISAYLEQSFHGNLFSLLDAPNWMAEIWDLPNHLLPEDFVDEIIYCQHDCAVCPYCKTLFDQLVQVKPVTIEDRRLL